MSSKAMTWDAEADRKLLLGILKKQNVSVDFDAMAQYMTTDTQKCTASAIKNRLGVLKRAAKDADIGGTAADDDATPKAKATPRKRAAAGSDAGGGKKKAKGKGKAKDAEDEAGDDDEDNIAVGVKQELGEEDFII